MPQDNNASLAIVAAGRSSTGRVRSNNEDAVLVEDSMFAVADGMGGHAAGEHASAHAVRHLATLAGRPNVDIDEVRAALAGANQEILNDAELNAERRGMGTTVVGMIRTFVGGSAHWLGFNVGDSRLYEFRPGGVHQLSIDHSEVQELIDAGRITPGQARTHPERHVLTRSLGTLPPAPADIWMFPLEAGTSFVLCSDGLSDELTDAEISAICQSVDDPDELADRLVGAAEAAGGRDNVSVVVVRVVGMDDEDREAATTAPRKERERQS